jgi:hypothetical protein
MKKLLALLSVSFLCIFLFSANAYAIALIFDQTPYTIAGGTLYYDGIGGSFSGDDIGFQTITPFNTPANSGVGLTIEGGLLDFETGDLSSSSSSELEFGSGGFFTLTGTVKNGGSTLFSGNILSGSFSGGATYNILTNTFSAAGIDTKHPELVNFYGLQDYPGFIFANTEIAASGVFNFDGSFDGEVLNADITNTAVPEPATMLLLGFGMIGLAVGSRKKLFKK